MKKAMNFRFSEAARARLDELCGEWSCTRTAVLERLLLNPPEGREETQEEYDARQARKRARRVPVLTEDERDKIEASARETEKRVADRPRLKDGSLDMAPTKRVQKIEKPSWCS